MKIQTTKIIIICNSIIGEKKKKTHLLLNINIERLRIQYFISQYSKKKRTEMKIHSFQFFREVYTNNKAKYKFRFVFLKGRKGIPEVRENKKNPIPIPSFAVCRSYFILQLL